MKAYVVDSAAVRSNLQQLQTRAGSAVLWAVLKGDGYGLGLLPMAAICREAGVTHFAVTEVSEVSRLRAGGFADASILMLRPTSEQDELRQLVLFDLGMDGVEPIRLEDVAEVFVTDNADQIYA